MKKEISSYWGAGVLAGLFLICFLIGGMLACNNAGGKPKNPKADTVYTKATIEFYGPSGDIKDQVVIKIVQDTFRIDGDRAVWIKDSFYLMDVTRYGIDSTGKPLLDTAGNQVATHVAWATIPRSRILYDYNLNRPIRLPSTHWPDSLTISRLNWIPINKR